jgi:heat shock protein HspQ
VPDRAEALHGRGSARLADKRRFAKPLSGTSGDQAKPALVSHSHKSYICPMNRATYYSPQAGRIIDAPRQMKARFAIGDIVRHRHYDFRGVVFDIDPVFANSEEWYDSIPAEVRPKREQPFYHLLAENEDASYVAYVSQQNLMRDAEGGPVDHPSLPEMFEDFAEGRYRLRQGLAH